MPGAPTAVVVLAAGAGTRMKSQTPKVLHPIGGRSLLDHVLRAARPLGPGVTVVVVGSGREQVTAHLSDVAPDVRPVVQDQQRGSGHATRLALDAIGEPTGTIVVLNGDVPLLTSATIRALVTTHDERHNAMTVLTAVVPDPTGLGRIIRSGDGLGGGVQAIVEHRDATPDQRAISEINAGAYVFDAASLSEALSRVGTDNTQGEEYLTEVVTLMVEAGAPVGAYVTPDYVETLGCNDRVELAERGRQLNDRTLRAWMQAGVTVVDPATTWVDVDAELAADVTLWPNVHLRGATRVESGAEIGPDCTLIDTEVGPGATVVRTHALLAVIGPRASVGPFAYLRPKAVLHDGAKVGTFVEVKNSDLGPGAKVPHLSYIGDATIGEGTNIGANAVTANYDGVHKNRTTIGRWCKTGVDTMFVAPVTVGDGVHTGAGTVVREDVPPGALVVSAGPQRTIEGWVFRRRPGTPSAEAAQRALARTDAGPADDESGPTS